MKTSMQVALLVGALVVPGQNGVQASGGDLSPPGAPEPTMKTLDEVKPGVPLGQDDLPLVITQPGVYYLKEAVTVSALETHGIEIMCDNVSIDLNGFTLSGPGKKLGRLGSGVWLGVAGKNLAVYNGSVTQWAEFGVDASACQGGRIERVGASDNGGSGISVGIDMLVRDCVCTQNGSKGIVALERCKISGNLCNVNGRGIQAGSGCVISQNLCVSNRSALAVGILAGDNCSIVGNTCADTVSTSGTAVGILAGSGCVVRENTSRNNVGTDAVGSGIQCGASCHVEGNTCADNNDAGGIEPGIGIDAVGEGCVILNNNCHKNGNAGSLGYGIRLGPSAHHARVEGNHCTSIGANPGGDPFDSAGIQVESDSSRFLSNTLIDIGYNETFFYTYYTIKFSSSANDNAYGKNISVSQGIYHGPSGNVDMGSVTGQDAWSNWP